MRYALLVLPAANRVYADASVDLLVAELEITADAVLAGRVADVRAEVLGGVPYVTFAADELSPRDVRYLSNLSARYALFEVAGADPDQGVALRPVTVHPLDRLDDDLTTIQKYPGKTNELFTKLLLNVTVMASRAAGELLDRPLRVLDPFCGRGTTLNRALVDGFHASGIDVDGRDVDAYATFVRTYLKRKRLKHTASYGPVRRDKKVIGKRLDVTLGLSREEYRAGDVRELSVVQADTHRCAEFFRPGSFDVVVGDAPYGVQHGSRDAAGNLARSPLELLRTGAPVWASMLRPGGALGISWNTHVAPRRDAVAALAEHGLEVLDDGPWRRLRHRVDASIDRDVVVARKA